MARGTIDDLLGAERVLCYGVTGSGKSTLAARLGPLLGLPVVLVDELGWLPGWESREADELRVVMLDTVARERWILDSVWGSQREVVLPRVQVIVALDLRRATSLRRLLGRTLRRLVLKETMLNGNVETLRRAVSRDSIVRWHFSSWRSKRDRIRGWEADPHAVPVLRLRSPRQVDALLRAVRGAR